MPPRRNIIRLALITAAILWTRRVLSADDVAWLGNLPLVQETGDITLARAISRKLAQALAGCADPRGRVLPSGMTLRYFGWAVTAPTALLLLLHGLILLTSFRS